jgi:two-component system chemotaxis response regulator CheY
MSPAPYRILLIDDSAPFRRHVGGALESSGLHVVEAGDGVEALWRARSEVAFDLVLVDIHMPNLDGLTLIREVRKLPGYAEVPIIVITSDGSRDRRQEGRRAGATAWLLKPPDLPGLINSVHSALMRVPRLDASPLPSQRASSLGSLASRHPSTAAPDSRGSLSPRTRPPAARSEQPPLRPQRPVPSGAAPLARRARPLPARNAASEARGARTGTPHLPSMPSTPPDKRAHATRPRPLVEPRSGAEPRNLQEPRSVPAGARTPSTEPGAAPLATRAPSMQPGASPLAARAPSTEPRGAVAEARLKSAPPRSQRGEPRPASKGPGRPSED